MPNNRQMAIFFWLALLAAWGISRPDVRSGIRQLFRVAANPKILVALLCLSAWMTAVLWFGKQMGLWEASLATDTAFWFVGSGLVLFFAFRDVSRRPGFLWEKSVGFLGPMVLLEGLVDALVFPLPVELGVQPLFALVGALWIIAARDERYRPVTKLLNGLKVVIGIAILAHVVGTLATGWDQLDHGNLALQVALPVWTRVGLVPFVYAFALIAEYETAFMRLDWNSKRSRRGRLRSKLALLTSFHLKAHELASFGGPWQQDLASAASFREARGVIRAFRGAQNEKARAEAEAKERLVRFAGVDGVGDDGKRLDQREFKETTEALRWLASCMMGWYRNDDRYVPDLLERLGDDFSSHGLPQPSGLSLHVAPDGQAWYAWRRTVTGWCFAIGVAGPPRDEWEYDGPQPPGGFPGEDAPWGTQSYSSTVNLNWSDGQEPPPRAD